MEFGSSFAQDQAFLIGEDDMQERPAADRLLEGSSIDGFRSLKPHWIDLAFADPPYNIGYSYDVYQDRRESRDYLAWTQDWLAAVHRSLKETGTLWLAIGDEYAAEVKGLAEKTGFHLRSWVIW